MNRVAVSTRNHGEFAILVRDVICGLLVAIGLTTSLMAQAQPGDAGHCAGLPSFGPEDSLNTADLKVETKDLRVRVSANGPELQLRLEADPGWKPTTEAVQRVGWIRVFSCETGDPVQSLEADIWSGPEPLGGPERFLRFFETRDVNFDGYLDIAVLREFGAKWGSQTWWVFSPESGKFISDEFTKALGKVSANGLVLDRGRQNILAGHSTIQTGCGGTQDIYHVEQNRRLVLIHKEEISLSADGCTLTTRDWINGRMQVTKLRQFPPYRGPSTHP